MMFCCQHVSLYCFIFLQFLLCESQPTLSINKIVNGKGTGKTNIEFQGHSRSIQLTTGQTYSIECKSDDFSNAPWTVNGVGVAVDNSRPNSGSLVYYTDNTANPTLFFQNFQSNMTGNYTCTSISGSLTLEITEGNPIVIIKSEFSTKSVNDAETLILKVFVSGNPEPSADNITWYLNNELLTSQLASSKGFDISITGTSAFITPDNGFQLSMEGKYECHVTSLAGTATASNTLDIHSRPSVTLSSNCNCLKNTEIIVTINTTFSITCNDSNGDPPPTFTWLKDDIELNNESVTIQQLSNSVSRLTITNIQTKQAGIYTCKANNVVGKNHQDVTVNIAVAPQITYITFPTLNVPIGKDMKLLVIYEGGYPDPTVTWTRYINGIVSNVLNDSRASVSGQHGLNLTLVNVTLEDRVIYVLNVTNGVGSVRLEFNVTILFPPVLTLLSNRVSYRHVGSYVVFQVGISSAQPPVTLNDLVWEGNNVQSEQLIISLEDNIAIIVINNLTLSNTGKGRLLVLHQVENKTENFHLTVGTCPSVTLSSNCNCLKNTEIIVTTNTTFSITCNDSNGDPPPTFTWLKDNIELNNDSVTIQQLSNRVSHLTINDIQAKQAGRYTCRANNVIGENHQDVTVNIAVTPRITHITLPTLNVPIGKDMKLSVIYEGGYPDPTVTWTRHINGIVSNVLNDSRASVSGQHGLNLTLVNVTLEDRVIYVLNVTNGVGSVRLEFNVTILFPPVLTLLTKRVVYLHVGSYVVFQVGISSAQPPVTLNDLVWEGNNVQSGQLKISIEDSIAIIVINNLTLSNTGKGRLLVLHQVENKTENFHLTVGIPPGHPVNFTLLSVNSTAVIFSWDPPLIGEDITNYTLICYEIINDISYLVDWTFVVNMKGSVNLILNKFRPGTPLNCSLNATNNIGTGYPTFGTTITHEQAPGGPPMNFSIMKMYSHKLTVQWLPPDPFLQYGIIINYTLSCYETESKVVPSSLPRVFSHPPPVNVTVDGLQPFTMYNCTIVANNSAGQSTPASDSGQTVSEGSNSTSTINITILLTSTIVVLILLTITIIIIITIVVSIVKRQKFINRYSVTDKRVSHGQMEMFSHQITQLSHTPRSGGVLSSNYTTDVPRTLISSGADHIYEDINMLSQKSPVCASLTEVNIPDNTTNDNCYDKI